MFLEGYKKLVYVRIVSRYSFTLVVNPVGVRILWKTETPVTIFTFLGDKIEHKEQKVALFFIIVVDPDLGADL